VQREARNDKIAFFHQPLRYPRPMGLDAVEIVLRTEDLFAITLTDDEAAAVRTVGDFYRLICSKLDVTPLPSPVTSAELPTITIKEKKFLILRTHTPPPAPPEVRPYHRPSHPASRNPLSCNNLRPPKTIFFKNNPKSACQAPPTPQNPQTPYIHWRINFPTSCVLPVST
jgi:hypothetical protein